MPKAERVVVALSGGVDSSVAAALLNDQGYEVIGVMLRLWSQPGKEGDNRCCTPDSISIARRVAAQLAIPFYVLDAKEVFYNTVVQAFLTGYAQNRTPNPCLVCNQYIRWGFLLDRAISFGARYLATGHYTRLHQDESRSLQILQATDTTKDQSYVLYHLGQHQLHNTLFPIGELTKQEVRTMAEKYHLPVANRPESQDLCFLSGSDYRNFLAAYTPEVNNPGPILTQKGELLGTHPGLAFYTIGQRKGLGISSARPTFVLEKDSLRNALIVGHAEDLGRYELIASNTNWVSGIVPEQPLRAYVKIRYTAKPELAYVYPSSDKKFRIKFDKPIRDITPGQAAVIYQNDICLGGGIITSTS